MLRQFIIVILKLPLHLLLILDLIRFFSILPLFRCVIIRLSVNAIVESPLYTLSASKYLLIRGLVTLTKHLQTPELLL